MDSTELLTIFATFTKEDWIEFDRMKTEIFQPTPEELSEQETARLKAEKITIINYLTVTLALYNITFEEMESYESLIYAYIFNTPDLKEFLGGPDRLQARYELEIASNNSLKGLYNLVTSFE